MSGNTQPPTSVRENIFELVGLGIGMLLLGSSGAWVGPLFGSETVSLACYLVGSMLGAYTGALVVRTLRRHALSRRTPAPTNSMPAHPKPTFEKPEPEEQSKNNVT